MSAAPDLSDVTYLGPSTEADLPLTLRPYVTEYYEAGWNGPAGQTLCQPVGATTEPFLNATFSGSAVVRLAARLRIHPFPLPPVTIGGPQAEAYEIEVTAPLHGFYVRFTTVGTLALLGVRDYGVSERGVVLLHEMVRPALAEAARRYSEAVVDPAPGLTPEEAFARRVAASNAFFLSCLPDVPHEEVSFLQQALDEIEAAGGNVRIGALAETLGVSANRLRRRFRVLGMPVKHFAEVVRFRRAHAFLHTTPDATWADAVARFGYSDQAHFIRVYRRLAGVTPTRWKDEERPVDLRMGIEEARPL